MNKLLLTITSACIGVSCLYGQQSVSISKAEVLSKVQKENTAIKIAASNLSVAKADYHQTRAIFLPNITASHTVMTTNNPLMAFGIKLNQEKVTAADFNPSSLNNPKQIQNFATKFEIQQPIFNLDGVFQRKAAKIKAEAQQMQLQRTKDYIAFEVENSYMQLQLAYKGVAVMQKVLQTAEANLDLANKNFNQGYLQKADVLNVEVRVLEVKNQLQTALSNVENASNYLSFLMHEDAFVVYKPSDVLQPINSVNNYQKSIEERADIKAMELSTKAYAHMVKAVNMSFLPKLNAFGSYELYDNEIFTGDASGYIFGAQLRWNLFEGAKRLGKKQQTKAAFKKATLEFEQYTSQSKLELEKAKRMLIDAANNLELSKLAMQQSEESLRIRTNRFKEGLEKTTDLLQAETQYASKELAYYQAIYQYNYAQLYLKYLSN
ncbi:TolC family protein [Tenacibaculum geojense]|uniref:TolC family protein n=1 Tax=Tenacibaculum geojense TaxID=915352 RepID=A0ABW3JT25_9FLAO